MKTQSIRLCITAVFVAVLAITSWITIPAAVPFTMQTFAVYLMLFVLPPVCSFGAVSVYLVLGAIGLPVFAGFQGGFAVLLGPFGGFLWSFLLMTATHWLWRPRSPRATLLAVIAESLLCYAMGAVWFSLYSTVSLEGLPLFALLTVAPFILPDALKLCLAWQLARRIRPHLPL